jgi:predicted GNAT family N-acyltransferase
MNEAGLRYRIRLADWRQDADKLRDLRRAVFVNEQGVPEALEWDGRDADALHLLAEDAAGRPLACARLLNDGRIGRMAVLAHYRGRGIGAALLARLIDIARRQGLAELHLHAQLDTVDFYRRAGFCAEGAVFEEAGIPHQVMTLAVH